jgi:hypothetical protein
VLDVVECDSFAFPASGDPGLVVRSHEVAAQLIISTAFPAGIIVALLILVVMPG